jgi:hypothetical protein
MVDILGVAGLVAAFVVPSTIEALKKPRIEIVPVRWEHPGQGVGLMTFASVQVRNKPLPVALSFLDRRPAYGCRIYIDWWVMADTGSKLRKFATIQGRWDSHPEPLKISSSSSVTFPPGVSSYPGTVPTTGPSAPTVSHIVRYEYDAYRVSFEESIAPGSDIGGISPAILRNRAAYAFADESYAHVNLANPDWELERDKTYLIEIRVKGSNATCSRAFKLEYMDYDFRSFQLQAADKE